MGQKHQIGGQAVIEGIMMRGPKSLAVAVRRADGRIATKISALSSWGDRWSVFKLPFFRGLAALVEALSLGVKTLLYSANESGAEEEEISEREMGLTVAVAFLIAVGLFMVLPVYLTRFLQTAIPHNAALNGIEFAIRMSLFVLYIVVISRADDVKRLFAYHGAEHKAVHAYEAGLDLTPENVQKQSTLHPRCGTSFILIVFMVSMLFFVWIGYDNFLIRVLSRLLLLPLIAGVSYEIVRLAGKSRSSLLRVFCLPGLALQKLTTREPDQGQIEVAVEALQAVLRKESPARETDHPPKEEGSVHHA